MARQKATFASVTTKLCACRWPHDVAAEPENGVAFDKETKAYVFLTPGGGTLMIYHCPFCGGAMPRSPRAERFAHVTEAEVARLTKLTSSVRSIAGAVRVLGKPEDDRADGLLVRTPAKGRKAPSIAAYRVVTFTGASKTADIEVIDYGPEGVKSQFVCRSGERALGGVAPRGESHAATTFGDPVLSSDMSR